MTTKYNYKGVAKSDLHNKNTIQTLKSKNNITGIELKGNKEGIYFQIRKENVVVYFIFLFCIFSRM